MSHHCHATGCTIKTPREMFMCRRHWYSLPKHLRDEIWRTYRHGQCDDMQISHDYANAARDAVCFIAAKEGVKPDIRLYDVLDPVKTENTPAGGKKTP